MSGLANRSALLVSASAVAFQSTLAVAFCRWGTPVFYSQYSVDCSLDIFSYC